MPKNSATPPRGGFASNQRKPDTKALRRLLSYIVGGYKVQFALVILCILVSSLTGVAGSMFLRTVIDSYIKPLLLDANPVFTGLLHAIFTMACVYAVGLAASYAFTRIMVVISQGVLKTIRDDMFVHMQTLPIRYFDTHTHGDVMSHYTNDTDTLRQMIAMSLPQLLSSVVTVVAVLGAMLILSPILTGFVLVSVACMLTVSRKIVRQSGKYFVRQQTSLADVNGYVEEMMQGQKVVKVFCHEAATKAEFEVKSGELCENATQANRFANMLMPIMGNLGNLLYVLVAVVGGALALGGIGGITLGAIASFLQLTKNFTMPINQVAQQFNFIVMALAGAGRIFQLMDEEPEQDTGDVTLVRAKEENGVLTETKVRTKQWAWKRVTPTGAEYIRLCGDVRLIDVDFGYVPEKPVLHDVSLYAKPGQKIAFVGATGAGKTTITNLINRFYDVNSGQILYDGVDVKDIRKADLRRSLGMVLQETNLFTGTVMENIRYGKLDATDADVIAAAKLANAHDFITRLPQGYDTLLSGDGGGLSQGQRQLLSIARAAVADPPVMILDEATSSIDTRTEEIVQRGMDSLMQGRTVFVIAHRLSTVQNAKAIMVLEQGRIVERGDHDALLEQKGRYYRLYTGSFAEDA
ncbi:MAG: ABC transporter ATP-binding protein/permease [Christensenellaceae bacterium]|jgi:ATP-binding cassette subfamily B protein|nr:ABC transporter ATP-binding protein/permease [Christensenellaceae bacterium]